MVDTGMTDVKFTTTISRLPEEAKLMNAVENQQNLMLQREHVRYYPQNGQTLRWVVQGTEATGQGAVENLPSVSLRIVNSKLSDLANAYIECEAKLLQGDGATALTAGNYSCLQHGIAGLFRQMIVSVGGKVVEDVRDLDLLYATIKNCGAKESYLNSADHKLTGCVVESDKRFSVADAVQDAQARLLRDGLSNNNAGKTIRLPLSHILGFFGMEQLFYSRGVSDLTLTMNCNTSARALIKDNSAVGQDFGVCCEVRNLRVVVPVVNAVSSYYSAIDSAVASSVGLTNTYGTYASQSQSFNVSTDESTHNLSFSAVGRYLKHALVIHYPSATLSDATRVKASFTRLNGRDFQAQFRGMSIPNNPVPNCEAMEAYKAECFGWSHSVLFGSSATNVYQICNRDSTGRIIGERNQIYGGEDATAHSQGLLKYDDANGEFGDICKFVQAYQLDPSIYSGDTLSGISTSGSANSFMVQFTAGEQGADVADRTTIRATGEYLANLFLHKQQVFTIKNLAVSIEG